MTKTQQTLIQKAKDNGGQSAVTRVSGCGADGGLFSSGSRATQALRSLESAGLVTVTYSRHESTSRNGYTMNVYTLGYKLN